jgi:hypothetical protein
MNPLLKLAIMVGVPIPVPIPALMPLGGEIYSPR